jgi:hypothetical protein
MMDEKKFEKFCQEINAPKNVLILGSIKLALDRILDQCAGMSLRQVQDREPMNNDFLWLWDEVRKLKDMTRSGEKK